MEYCYTDYSVLWSAARHPEVLIRCNSDTVYTSDTVKWWYGKPLIRLNNESGQGGFGGYYFPSEGPACQHIPCFSNADNVIKTFRNSASNPHVIRFFRMGLNCCYCIKLSQYITLYNLLMLIIMLSVFSNDGIEEIIIICYHNVFLRSYIMLISPVYYRISSVTLHKFFFTVISI